MNIKRKKKIVIRKGAQGKSQRVQCDSCGRKVPRGKTIRLRKYAIPLDAETQWVLKKKNARIHCGFVHVYYCISCAKHRRII